MKKGIKSYVLIGETKSPFWQLRHNKVLVEDGKNGLRQIRYAKGAKSIWDDEIDSRLKTERIDFKDGKFEANEADKVLVEYLEKHPEFNVKFKLLDPLAEAKEQLEKDDLVFEAQSKVRQLSDDELEAVAIHIFGNRAVQNKDTKMIKKDLLDYVKQYDQFVNGEKSKTEYFLEVIDLPILEIKRIVVAALNKGVIKISSDKNTVMWGDTGKAIVAVPSGKNPLDKLSEFMLEDEGQETLKELGKQLDKPRKKTKAA